MQRIRYSRYLKSIIILLDLLVIAGVFVLYFFNTSRDLIHDQEIWYETSFPLLLVISFWILLSGRTKIYNISRNLTYILFVERIIIHFLLFIIGLVLIRKVSGNQFFWFRTNLALALPFCFYIFIKIYCLFFDKIHQSNRSQPQECDVS